MDTTAPNEPVGVEDITPSPDTSVSVTQPVETGEVTGTEPAETGEPETLYAGKYKSTQELEKAYQEAQKLNGQLSQKAQLANKLSEKYGATPEQVLAQIEQQELQAKQERYANNPLAPLVDEVSELKQFINQQQQEKAMMAVEKELDTFIKDNPDYEPFRDKLKKLTLTEGIGYDAQGEVPIQELATEYFGQARAQGQQDAYRKIDTKLMNQATGASTAPHKTVSADNLRGMSAAEMESILPRA